MFFADRVAAFREVHRVLRPGGTFVFTTWDRLAENRVAALVDEAAGGDTFFARIPHGYFDRDAIRADVTAAGFAAPAIDLAPARSRAATAEDAARALCAGTPLRDELAARGTPLEDAIAAATTRIARELGPGPIDAAMQALFVEARRS